MFTGIIEEVGKISAVRETPTDYRLTITAQRILEDIHIGDSIAVNGVCLTVTTYTTAGFTVDVMPETIKATSLKQLQTGSIVNLERAMAANGRFGGHIVSGHVDTIGKIKSRRPEANAIYYIIELEQKWMKYIVPKGSIAVDGISLTVFNVEDHQLTVSLIPHTLKETNLQTKREGDPVNLECDMLAKYMERLLQAGSGEKREQEGSKNTQEKRGITLEQLSRHGYV